MKLLYVSSSSIPSPAANSVQVMRMCNAFARLGHDVTLLAAPGDDALVPAGMSVPVWYGVDAPFAIDTAIRSTRKGVGMVVTARRVGATARASGAALAYGRDPVGLLGAAHAGVPVAYEVHHPPASRRRAHIERQLLGHPQLVRLVAITGALAHRYRAAGARAEIVVAHDAADDPGPRPGDATAGGAGPVVGYCGSLRPGKGAELVVEVARRLPTVRFVIVGGSPSEVATLGATAPANVELVGAVAPAAVPGLLRRFAVALAPYGPVVHGAAGSVDLAPWMSPLKVYEYLAAGVAMVTSDLPVLREVLRPDENAVLAPAGDVDAWATAIGALLGDDDRRAAIAAEGRRAFLAGLTWERRAAAVLDGIPSPAASTPAAHAEPTEVRS